MCSFFSCFSQKDTVIYTYWKNGNVKTESYFKIKKKKYDKNTILNVLCKKKTRYFNPKGTAISKQDFNFFFNHYTLSERNDSLLQKERTKEKFVYQDYRLKNEKQQKSKGIRINLYKDSVLYSVIFPESQRDTVYKRKDTMLTMKLYEIALFVNTKRIASNLDTTSLQFIGAIRSEKDKLFYFDNITQAERVYITADSLRELLISSSITTYPNKSFPNNGYSKALTGLAIGMGKFGNALPKLFNFGLINILSILFNRGPYYH